MAAELISKGVEVGWHAIKRTFSVVITLLLIAGIGWLVYVGMIRPHTKPNPLTTQKAENISNLTENYNFPRFGCATVKQLQEKAK